MFIFNIEGKLLYKSKEKINETEIIDSYSLTFLNITDNYFDYLLAYFDVDCHIHLNLYRYDNKNNNITLLYESRRKHYHFYKNEYYNFRSENKLLSCEYIYYPYSGNRILCFYNSNPSVGILMYEIKFYYNNEMYFHQIYLENKFFILVYLMLKI